MSIGRICVRKVDTAKSDESAKHAAKRMHDRKVGTLVVVNSAHEPVGIITDRDLAVRVVGQGGDPAETKVEDVMTDKPRCISEDTPIEEALQIMRSGEFRRLPVVSGRRLVGLVSLDDILDLIMEEFASVHGLLQKQLPRSLTTV